MRAERLLRILLALQSRGQLTVGELSSLLDVSPRTVQRDLTAMSLAGVPIYATRGRGGGWSLLPDFRSRLFGLTAADAMAVFVGATSQVLADLGLDSASEDAYTKLLLAVPGGVRRDAEFALRRILVDQSGWEETTEQSTWLTTCRQGLWEERRIIMRYGKSGSRLTVGPLGLVSKGRAWYLVALRGADLRTYRVSRIASAELTDERFDRPPDFDLGGYWSAAVRRLRGQWPSYPVVLAVRDPVVARFAARPGARIVADVPGLDDGWSLVHTDLENRGEALGVVLSLAGDAIAREPAELCREVAMAAARIADRHRG